MEDSDDRPATLASLRQASRRPRPPQNRQPDRQPDPRSSSASPSSSTADPQLGLFFTANSRGIAPGPAPLPNLPAPTPASRPAPPPAPRPATFSPITPAPATVQIPAPLSTLRPAPAPTRRIWTVRALVNDVREHIESGYADLWVEGELSNCRSAPSGHIYLTLKDGEAQLPVVLFRKQANLLRFRPTDGLAVLVRGRVSVYEGRGQLQLIAETMEPRGAGALQVAFEQLKARLLAEGLFEAARKRPLPLFPRCVGVITSTGGAVIRDIITVSRRRHARLNLLIYPAVMQGAGCPASVTAGLRWFANNRHLVDLVVIARGGGSLEDLAGFNEESVARAIAASPLPVVSAIGHETDFTIADFVADLRAPTPSAAAELVTAAQHRIEERLESLHRSILRAGRYHLLHARTRFDRISAPAVLRRLHDAIGRREQRVDDLEARLETAAEIGLRLRRQRLAALTERLRRQDASLRLAVGKHRLASARGCLDRAARQIISGRRPRLDHLHGRLEALSPLAVLARGYALVYAANGTLLRSPAEATMGETITARLAGGSLLATVTETSKP